MRFVSLMLSSLLIAFPSSLQAACGSRGGPAFRGPDGKCVGWAGLDRVCGTPPTTRCTYEGGGLGDTGQEKGQAYLSGMLPGLVLKSAPPSNFHVRKVKADGIACTSQAASARVTNICATLKDAAGCKAEVDAVLHSGECVRLSAGTDVTIEAGSHSFDWLRFRIQGRPAPLWSERKLILD